MKQSLLTLVLGVSLASGSAFTVAAQDTSEPIFKVTTEAEFNQCTPSVYDYVREPAWAWYSGSGGYMRLWYYTSYSAYVKDYITTPDLALEAGSMYKIELTPISYTSGTSNAATIELLLGQGDDPRNFSSLAEYTNLPYIGTPNASHLKSCEFTVAADGNYRISILGKSKFAKVYNFQVFKLGPSACPGAPADFTVTPDASGATNATVTFTLPSSTITGQALSGELSYTIKREGTEVNSGTGAPGAAVSWTDAAAPEGVVKYSVEVSQGEETADAVETTVFIGIETPAAVGNPAFTSEGDVHTITWEAPAGIHGTALNAASLVYTVSRVLDGNATELGTVTGTTTYTDTYTPSRPVKLQYSITATNVNKVSEPALTESVRVGHIDLPFADSFAGASFGGAWDVERASTGVKYEWTPLKKFQVGRYGSSADILPVDDDGGLAGFESYSAQTDNQSRLVTAPISRSSSIAPAVEFWFHHDSGQNSKTEEGIKLQVSNDNGEWVDVADGHIIRYKPADSDQLGWQKYTILLGDALAADCSTYRVGFLTVNECGNNMALDAVRIFNAVEGDMQVSVNGPATLIAGKEATLEVNVANNGSTPIAATAYTLDLASDLGVEFTAPELVDLPPLSSVKYTYTFTIDAAQAAEADSYTFTATVNYPDDTLPDNNTSAPLEIATGYAAHASVMNLAVSDGENGKTLAWDAAGEPGYAPLKISEDFENSEIGATDNINGFTILDLDEKAGSTWYMCSGSKLNVFKPNSTLEVKGEHALGVTTGSSTQQDDWLISPALSAADISTFELSLKIGFKGSSSSSSYVHKYEVLYATDDFDAANPAAAFSNQVASETTSSYGTNPLKADNKLNSRKYTGIPPTAKYIAIHLNSKISYGSAMWVDDILIEENNPAPLLGYNVYQKGVGRLNAEMLSSTELSFLLESLQAPADGSDLVFFVTAVYPDGEAAPSNEVTIALPKAPVNLTAERTHDVFTGRNDITLAWDVNEDAPYADDVKYEVSYNGQKLTEVTDRTFTMEYASDGEHLFEVCALTGGLKSPAATVSHEIKAEEYAKLSVAVTSNNGYLPEEYSVTIATKGDDSAEPYVLAHENNAVEIGFLPVGEYTASLSLDGFKPWSEDVNLAADVAATAALEELTTVPFGLSVTHQDGENGHEYLFKWNEQDPSANYIDTWRVVDFTVSLDGEMYADNVEDNSLLFTDVAEGEHTAGVKANYASGTTDEATVKFLGLSGVGGVKAMAGVAGLTGAIRVSVAGEASVTVYNASGVAVASASLCDETVMLPAAPGIYLVVVGTETVKVSVK